jgi:hypothetical protein
MILLAPKCALPPVHRSAQYVHHFMEPHEVLRDSSFIASMRPPDDSVLAALTPNERLECFLLYTSMAIHKFWETARTPVLFSEVCDPRPCVRCAAHQSLCYALEAGSEILVSMLEVNPW